MSDIVVSQEQFDAANRAQSLLNSLLNDPKSGLGIKKAIKDKFPGARIPDLDFAEQVTRPYDEKLAAIQAQNDALKKSFDEYRQKNETRDAETALRSSLDSVRSKYGFTDDGMQKVIEAMQTRNLAHDPEAAAALIASQMPKPPPASTRSSLISPKLDIYGMQDSKSAEKWNTLHQDPWTFFTDECVAVMDEYAQAAA